MKSDAMKKAREEFYTGNQGAKKCSDFEQKSFYRSFNIALILSKDFWTATTHFSGSFNVVMNPNCAGTLAITVENPMTWKSFFRDIPHAQQFLFPIPGNPWMYTYNSTFPNGGERGGLFPWGGKMENTYHWTEPFQCECPCSGSAH